MSAAWAVQIPAGDKLVLLALADCANDEGKCWPGIRSLCLKTGKAERSLQGSIKALCAAGHLSREELPGKGCIYTVHPQQTFDLSPPQIVRPAEIAPPQETAETPAEIAGKPLEPSTSEDKSSSALAEFVEAWNSVAAPRGAIRCNRLSAERRRKLAPLLKRYPVEDLTEAIDAVGRSDFLTGRTPRKFRASITFLCSPEHVEKLLEGSYG